MKKSAVSFLAGAASMALVLALSVTALAASGKITCNAASVSLNGATVIAAGADITASNGQQIPGTILYTDAAGGGTNYLPIGILSQLLGVEARYDTASKTILLEGNTSMSRWTRTVENGHVTYQCADKEAQYDAPPAYRPQWPAGDWGLSAFSRGANSSVSYEYRQGSARITFRCAYPASNSFGWAPANREALENRQTITIQGRTADYYQDGSASLLVWENQEGILFLLNGTNAAKEQLIAAAESVTSCPAETVEYTMQWLPAGCRPFERTVLGDTGEEIVMQDGLSLSLLYARSSLAAPEGTPETVTVNGCKAQFYGAKEPLSPSKGEETIEVAGVTITTGTISGLGSEEVNTLLWSDPNTGMSFRLIGALDRETMVKIAENVK